MPLRNEPSIVPQPRPANGAPVAIPELDLLSGVFDRFWRPWFVPAGVLMILVLLAANVTCYWAPAMDSALYLSLARSLAAGNGYQIDGIPHTLVFPGFPLMLTTVVKLVGENFLVLNLLMALLAAGCVLLTWLLLRPWIGPRCAFVVAFVVGATDTLVRYSSRVLTDVPHLFFVLLALCLIQQMAWQTTIFRRLLAAVLAGAAVMAACMIRPNGLVLIPVACAALFWLPLNAMKLWEKLLSLAAWIVAIGTPLLLWYLFIEKVNVSSRRTYLGSSNIERGFLDMAGAVLVQLACLPRHLTESLAYFQFTSVGNLVVMLLVLIGLVRLVRLGAWHLAAYFLLGIGLLAVHFFNARYLLAVLPFTFLALLLGAAWILVRLQTSRPDSSLLRKTTPCILAFVILVIPFVNMAPIAKLTWWKYQRPFYDKFEGGRWHDEFVAAQWIRTNVPQNAVVWTRHNYILSYLSHHPVVGPVSAYQDSDRITWRSPKGLLRDFAKWQPDYVVVDTRSEERNLVDRLIAHGQIRATRVYLGELQRFRIYKLASRIKSAPVTPKKKKPTPVTPKKKKPVPVPSEPASQPTDQPQTGFSPVTAYPRANRPYSNHNTLQLFAGPQYT